MEVTHRTALEAEAIRSEFDRARQAAGDGDSISASTMNFIVFIDDPDHRAWVEERAMKIADKHPSRLLLLDATASRDEACVVTASNEDRGTMVLTERVRIPVRDLDPARMGSLALAVTRVDVPTVLWWTAPHVTTDPRFSPLADFVNSVLVDSSGTVRDGKTLAGLERFWVDHPGVTLIDLAWMRLAPWRDLIASAFDGGPNLRKELFLLRRLRIVSGCDAEALYLAGWMASRLGWQPTSPRSFTDRNGSTVNLIIERSGDMRRVKTVELDSDGTRYSGTVTEDPTVVALKAEGEHESARLATLSKIDNASLIELAILEPATDEIFETSLRIAAKLIT